ncbi:hypothetical protein [Streptomyces sp. SID8352]|uniref:hypothetical protein n=1 Tax=Streptomyces sp. SID8352 TaxID=2690338 RepID=UPI001F20DDE4|nr:hypothetical protein [Streptomyces sp. SID8352]
MASRELANLTGPLGSGKSRLAAGLRPATLLDLARPGAVERLPAAPAEDTAGPLVVDGADAGPVLSALEPLRLRPRAPAHRKESPAAEPAARRRSRLAEGVTALADDDAVRETMFPVSVTRDVIHSAAPDDADAIGALMHRRARHGGPDVRWTGRMVERWLVDDPAGFQLVRDDRRPDHRPDEHPARHRTHHEGCGTAAPARAGPGGRRAHWGAERSVRGAADTGTAGAEERRAPGRRERRTAGPVGGPGRVPQR